MKNLEELIGKTISQYDGWNGSDKYLVIDQIAIEQGTIGFISKSKNVHVWVPTSAIDDLINNGIHIKSNEIDHCPYQVITEIL